MERIPTSDLNRRLKEVLGSVAEGKAVILTRYGKDVARLGPPHDSSAAAREAAPKVRADELAEVIEDPRFSIHGSPKQKQSARDELLNRIRDRK